MIDFCATCGLYNQDLLETLQFNSNKITYCPNCMCIAILNGSLQEQLQNDENLIDDITGTHDAIQFDSKGESYCLNKDAMMRLLCHNLTPDEYAILAKKYGSDKFMLHNDFYTDNGIAIQPLILNLHHKE